MNGVGCFDLWRILRLISCWWPRFWRDGPTRSLSAILDDSKRFQHRKSQTPLPLLPPLPLLLAAVRLNGTIISANGNDDLELFYFNVPWYFVEAMCLLKQQQRMIASVVEVP